MVNDEWSGAEALENAFRVADEELRKVERARDEWKARAEIAAALGEETVSDDVNLGTITVSMRLDGDDATVQITLPDGELSNVQLLGMLDLARDEILHPSDDGGS